MKRVRTRTRTRKHKSFIKRKNFRKGRGTKRRNTISRRPHRGGKVGVDTNPNELNDEEKILERQSRIIV